MIRKKGKIKEKLPSVSLIVIVAFGPVIVNGHPLTNSKVALNCSGNSASLSLWIYTV